MSLDCGRRPEYPEDIYVDTGSVLGFLVF
uniref:Uncharacterized protein n=1 Tax=Anguilla anguilla TaxID=7936 RepID=A0A0E9T9Q0_ANGAN